MAGETIAGRYRLLEPLGRGAMSSVWLAVDEELGRRVAVKTLGENADRARFEREARAAAALSHPNICQLYDYGEVDGRPYMVLEHLPGGTLEQRLRTGAPLPDAETQALAEQLAAGLAHAHERALVHRDLKPANVLFDTEGRPKIADFGIARMGGSGTLTEAGTVLGTASYISPEQAGGLPATPASDVYSFGAILFRLLTGRLPFVSNNALELVRLHRDETPPPVSAFRADAPPLLARIAEAALAKDPFERPADGTALLAELRGGGTTTLLGPLPATARRRPETAAATQVVRPRTARSRSRLVPFAAALAALLVGGAALAIAVTRGNGGSSPPGSVTTAGLGLPTVTPGETTTSAPATTQAQTTTGASTAATTAAPTRRETTTRGEGTTTAPATVPATTAPPPPSATTATTVTTAPTAAVATTASTTVTTTTAATTAATTASTTTPTTTTAPAP